MVRSQPRTDLVGCLTRNCGSSCYIRGTQDTQKPVQVKHDSKGCLVHGSERGNTNIWTIYDDSFSGIMIFCGPVGMANFRYPCIVGWSIFQVANHYSPTYCHGQKVVKMLEQLDQIRVLVDGWMATIDCNQILNPF